MIETYAYVSLLFTANLVFDIQSMLFTEEHLTTIVAKASYVVMTKEPNIDSLIERSILIEKAKFKDAYLFVLVRLNGYRLVLHKLCDNISHIGCIKCVNKIEKAALNLYFNVQLRNMNMTSVGIAKDMILVCTTEVLAVTFGAPRVGKYKSSKTKNRNNGNRTTLCLQTRSVRRWWPGSEMLESVLGRIK